MAFYEPLSEHLHGMTKERLVGSTADSWESHHPKIRPYFEEYAPLLNAERGGVLGYHRSFAFGHYFTTAGEPSERLFAYLSSLVRFACKAGKIPVLKHCRSLGRVEWMRAAFPDALHVSIVRDPWTQWLSAQRLAAADNRYFLTAPLSILALNARHHVVRPVLQALRIDPGRLRRFTFSATYRTCDAFVSAASDETRYRSFLAFWIATAYTSLPHVELTLDSDLLAASRAYRKEIQEQIEQHVGVALDLRSARKLLNASVAARISASQVEGCHLDALEACAILERSASDPSEIAALEIAHRKLTDARAGALQAS
jgi:hypothetical protein